MLERAKELRRGMTPAEKILWKHLKANRLNGLHFRRQQVFHGYHPDFYCHQYELIVELDGGIHEFQKEYDAEREEYLKSLGFRIIRFTNEEINSSCHLSSLCHAEGCFLPSASWKGSSETLRSLKVAPSG
jgi:very-short-patch-repair endonuclease